MSVSVFAAALSAAAMILSPVSSAFGAATKIWVSDTASDFSAGEARGIAVGIDGSLVLSRDARRVDGVSEATLFGVAAGKHGEVYLATGDSGRIVRVPSSGKPEVFAALKEKEVTAIAVGPDGAVYAGGSPGGIVYRVEKGTATPYYESKARYVWALAFSGNVLYVGTGLPGEIHRVTAAGKGERIHGTPDAHVRSLAVDKQGRVWAGTSGNGLVLRVSPTGTVTTVYDSSKSEITSIGAAPDGRVWVAASSSELSGSGSEPISAPHETPATKPSKPSAAGAGEGDAKDKPEVTVSVSSARLACSASAA